MSVSPGRSFHYRLLHTHSLCQCSDIFLRLSQNQQLYPHQAHHLLSLYTVRNAASSERHFEKKALQVSPPR